MQQKTKNTILFVVLMAVVVGAWYLLQLWFPPKPAPTPPSDEAAKAEPIPPEGISRIALGLAAVNPAPQGESLWLAVQGVEQAAKAKPGPKVDEHPAPPPVVRREPTPDDKILHLGATARDSKFHLGFDLDPRGGGVRKGTLNKFQAATDQGRPAYLDKEQTQPRPMELIPEDKENPSYLLYHYEVSDSNRDKPDDKPLDTLGMVDWTGPGGNAPKITPSTLPDGREVQEVTFVSPEVDGVQISKTYSLTQGDYHLGLRVEIERKRAGDKPLKFRYQLVGAHGLPVEGKWYTGIFRNCLVGMVNKDKSALREFQDLNQLATWEGGNEIRPKDDYFIRYAGVAVQYFASVVVVDDHQEGLQDEKFIERVRPTLERGVTKGVVTKVERDRFSVKRADGSEQVFFYDEKDPDRIRDLVREEMHVAVIHTTGSYSEKLGAYPVFARDVRDEAKTQPLWEDDVTVRLMTAPVELKQAGDKVVHKYLLYNGPVKVMLLGQESGDAAVPAAVVSHYQDDLRLDTFTDYQSATWIGTIASTLYITPLLIKTTNLMHSVLYYIHLVIPNYILCIICLTVLVRGMMFPLSRKQALTSLRMQELAPELKELQKKYKDDKQGMAAAQMELYRKHGVNPFGTCWVLFLQMPIFMGLYYALQESIHFRLEGLAWWWVPNLAAPDMLIPWSESIPIISSPENFHGMLGFLYLGPYFNLLPVVAVSLMMIQQKMTMPPPTDEQQEMQQKMMKYMMVFMAIMFYKVAAGLCVYFIASNLWGFAERRLLPRRKKGADPKPPESYFQRLFGRRTAAAENGAAPAAPPPAAAIGITTGKADSVSAQFTPEPRGKKKRGRKQRRQDRARGEDTSRPKNEAAATTATAPSLLQRLRDWWDGVLEQARKK